MKRFCLLCFVALLPLASLHAQSDEALPILVQVLAATDDAQTQLDILKGMADGLKGRRSVQAPAGWDATATKLGSSANAQVRELTRQLSLVFGSASALAEMRKQMLDVQAPVARRLAALEALVAAKDAGLAETLRRLLKEPPMRGAALRGLAAYDDPQTPPVILELLPLLSSAEKRDALGTLAARLSFARPLVAALVAGRLAAKDLPADLVRQLRNYQQADLNASLDKHWGAARESTADKKAEMERYRKLLAAASAPKPDLAKGRAVFAKTCGQCHQLYGVGGKVGPDITGSNRADLDYLLHNILDPNAEIPNDYRTWNLDTKDERSVSGVLARQDATAVTIVTPTESLTVARSDIATLRQSELSMMPEGLLQALPEDEVRNLIAYLRAKEQVPLP
ncbi:MAG: c-type cytochrome [Verrucomicrobia bacterium]|nr:c-type cytochrome [Verrucomicrobiota bacterium]MBM3869948.1 c-type cytochrome [Verrucomicrobiota bacterium]